MHEMIEWWGPIFRDAYGASEVGTVCAITSEEWLKNPGSVGKAIPPFTAYVLDENLNELPAGTEGRLFFRDATGRGIIYPNDPQKTAQSNPEPGLFTLGEIGYINEMAMYSLPTALATWLSRVASISTLLKQNKS